MRVPPLPRRKGVCEVNRLTTDWKHDAATRYVRCLIQINKLAARRATWRREVLRVAATGTGIVAGLIVLWCL
jgi:hypothetical protein